MKQTDTKSSSINNSEKNAEYLINHDAFNKKSGITGINSLSSKELDCQIKNLSRPSFLGSIHLNKEAISHISSLDTLITGGLELKLTKSFNSILFNPITKLLIISMIIFNIIWLLMYII